MNAVARILIEDTRFGGLPALHAAPAERVEPTISADAAPSPAAPEAGR